MATLEITGSNVYETGIDAKVKRFIETLQPPISRRFIADNGLSIEVQEPGGFVRSATISCRSDLQVEDGSTRSLDADAAEFAIQLLLPSWKTEKTSVGRFQSGGLVIKRFMSGGVFVSYYYVEDMLQSVHISYPEKVSGPF